MNAHYQRAAMLMQQERYDLAEKELQQSLVQDPNDFQSMSLLAVCLSELKRYDEAEQAAANAITLAPDSSYCFYAASVVSLARNSVAKAEQEILTAIDLEPYDPDYFLQLAVIEVGRKNWQKVIDSTEVGLELDPEHVGCTNLRALALNKLGRKEEAGMAIQSALERSPEDAWSHANMGWTLLEKSKTKEALPHFKEALRLEPEMEWARVGVLEAMKGQFFIYRIFLGWLMWASKLKSQYMWGIVLGGWLGYRFCSALLENNPGLRPVLLPLMILYISFVVMTWVAMPLFNLLLRFNKYGRMVLSKEETRTSNWVGGALVLAIGSLVGWAITGSDSFLTTALSAGLMIPALASYYSSDQGWPRAAHGCLILALAALGSLILICFLIQLFAGEALSLGFNSFAAMLGLPFLLLAFISQFAVNFLIMAQPKKGTSAGKTTWILGLIIVGIGVGLVVVAMLLVALAAISDPETFLNAADKQGLEKALDL